jgi:hypothetical protein
LFKTGCFFAKEIDGENINKTLYVLSALPFALFATDAITVYSRLTGPFWRVYISYNNPLSTAVRV